MSTLCDFFGSPVPGPVTPTGSSKASHQAKSVQKTKNTRRRILAKASLKTALTPKKEGASPKKITMKKEPMGDSPLTKKSHRRHFIARRPPKGRVAAWRQVRLAGVKTPLSAYTLWQAENRARIAQATGSTDFATISRVVGEAWKALSDEAKAPYEARQSELREKFHGVKAMYKDYADTMKKQRSLKAKGALNAAFAKGNCKPTYTLMDAFRAMRPITKKYTLKEAFGRTKKAQSTPNSAADNLSARRRLLRKVPCDGAIPNDLPATLPYGFDSSITSSANSANTQQLQSDLATQAYSKPSCEAMPQVDLATQAYGFEPADNSLTQAYVDPAHYDWVYSAQDID